MKNNCSKCCKINFWLARIMPSVEVCGKLSVVKLVKIKSVIFDKGVKNYGIDYEI